MRDSFTIEIIKNGLTAIGDEMFVAMQRSSQSPIIYETLDFGVGLTDGTGRLIAQGNGCPFFLGVLDASVREVIAKFGADIHPGDVFMTNDPFGAGGTHLSDVALIAPIFADGELAAFAANKAHWTDVGGMSPGSWTTDATEIYQEGLRFPCIRVISKLQVQQAILDMIQVNTRIPDMAIGDFWAGVASLRLGEERFQSLASKYGLPMLRTAVDHLMDHARILVREELKKLPKGVFYAEDYIDDDGIGDAPLPVRVKVTITDDLFEVDYTGSHPQVAGPINNTYVGLVCAAKTVFKALTDPGLPANDGCFEVLRVVCPGGTIFTAQHPAAVGVYWETMMFAADLVWQALAPHLPHKLTAGHLGSVCSAIVSGTHPDTGEFFLLVEPLLGGWGAGCDKDGESGQFCIADGETFNIPIEVTEARYGVLVEQYAFHCDDGGAGEFRGGKGVVLDYRMLCDDAKLTASFGRHKYRPWSLDGGQKGSPNYHQVLRADGGVETHGKVARTPVAKGEVIRLVTATGGGYGDPRRRPTEKVMLDVKNGYITDEQAMRHYGLAKDGLPRESAPA
jgi:N-methylhydantoinase B